MNNLFKFCLSVSKKIITGISMIIPIYAAYWILGALIGRYAGATIMLVGAMAVYAIRARKHANAKVVAQQTNKT
jgi:predicted benzoate:H+ symporter BenE